MSAVPDSTTRTMKIASETACAPGVAAVAEKNSDRSMIGTISARAAAVMTSWPKPVDSSPASLSSGSRSPADVDMRMIASSSGCLAWPASRNA